MSAKSDYDLEAFDEVTQENILADHNLVAIIGQSEPYHTSFISFCTVAA